MALPGSPYFMFLISSAVFIPLPPSCLLSLSSEWIFSGTSLSRFSSLSPQLLQIPAAYVFLLLFTFEFTATLVPHCDRSLQGWYRGNFQASLCGDKLNMELIREVMCLSRTLKSLETLSGGRAHVHHVSFQSDFFFSFRAKHSLMRSSIEIA